MRSTACILFLLFVSLYLHAQTDSTKVTDTLLVKSDSTALPAMDTTVKAFFVTGTMGITYEGYGLNQRPQGSNIYSPRAPWNQGRLDLNPVFNFGNWLSIPVNINISLTPTNFAGPWSGFKQNGVKQNFLQWLTNPSNNLGISPHFKWGDILLGTQYIKYSDYSTGDVGIFGAGFDINPKGFIFKFFTGASQQGINYFPPDINGSYLRNHWMAQVGKEKEGKYKIAFNIAKVKDRQSSVSSPPVTQQPEESFTMSVLADGYTKNGWYIQNELAQSYYTSDITQPGMDKPSLSPFIKAKTSTAKDNALKAAIGKKGEWVDAGIIIKYVGAGFKTAGYPMLQNDYIDAVFNTRLTAVKSKLNFTGNIGQRTNNQSNTTIKSRQFIANTNFNYKFSEKWNIAVTYNNTGFRAGSSTAVYGIQNVSNNILINPAYTFLNNTKTVSHLLSLSYNYSKYKEMLLISPFSITDNNTHNITLLYVPTFFNRRYTPDFSLVYFYNLQSGTVNKLFTISSGLGLVSENKKWQFKGQLQYTIGKLNQFTGNRSFIAGITADRALAAKLHWNIALTANNFKYGDELAPPATLINSNYLESNVKTGFVYSF